MGEKSFKRGVNIDFLKNAANESHTLAELHLQAKRIPHVLAYFKEALVLDFSKPLKTYLVKKFRKIS